MEQMREMRGEESEFDSVQQAEEVGGGVQHSLSGERENEPPLRSSQFYGYITLGYSLKTSVRLWRC